MRQASRQGLAKSILTWAALSVGLFVLSLHAQPPGNGLSQPWAVPRPGAGGSTAPANGVPPGAGAMPGLPASGPGSNGVIRQGDLLKFTRNVPGDAKPIVLEADEVYTWNENGKVVFLLAGKVLVQQSVVQARFEQGVAWVDVSRYQTTGILHMDLYAEGQVRLDTSIEIQDGNRALLDLNTRGEFRVRGSKGKVQRQDRSQTEIVSRARRLGIGSAPQQPVRTLTPTAATLHPPVSGTPAPSQALPPVPGTAPVPSVPAPIQPAGGVSPPPSEGIRPMSFHQEPGRPDPAPSGLVQAQATEPAPAPGAPARTNPIPIPNPPSPSISDGFGPPESVPPPGQPLPVPSPQSPAPRAPTPSRPQSEPRSSGPAPAPILPAPTPANPPTPLPPPSRPEAPRPAGELPRQSTPERPLEHRLLPRTGDTLNLQSERLPDGRQVITVSGGLILNVRNVPKIGILDVEADRAVIWVKNRDQAERVAQNLRSDQGEMSTELEFYMAGHVILRSKLNAKEESVLEADELYYDVQRNVAVALKSRLELRTERFAASRTARIEEPIILSAPELFRTGPNTYEVTEAEIFSSKLPSDPGLKLLVAKATLTNSERPRTFFGQQVYDRKGNPVMIEESIVKAQNVFVELEGLPIFYTPYLVTDARDPLGPLETINFGGNQVFGAQFGVGLNLYKLLGVLPIEGTRWRVMADYLTRRGPALGTNFSYRNKFDSLIDENDPYGTIPFFEGVVRGYGIYDQATDILGGDRPPSTLTFHPPGMRGRALWRQGVFDLPGGWDVIAQMSLLSDRNFLEQYFKREFDQDVNQANFLYVKQQQNNWAWSALGQVRTSNWITTTQWLPRADGYLLGQDLFGGWLTNNTQVSLTYAQLRPSSDPPIPLQGAPNPPGYPQAFDPTTTTNSTGRFALLHEIALPLDLGAIKFAPYLKGALVEYTNALDSKEIGRTWGGLGARASLPLTRLYPEVDSELFNLKGINHKIVLGGNYFYARSNESFTRFPELDRLNDDATDEMLRDFKPYEPVYNPRYGVALATSPYFDTQTYAIRRLVDNRIDTLEGIQVVQLDLRQRLQTKRGFPGFEHIVDWMTLNTSVSLFPQPDRDNFGKSFSFLEYEYMWNIGDRTTLESSGWYDPQKDGVRVFTLGTYFNRPDRTSFYVGYRQTDPLESRVVLGAVTYVFSPKYAMTLATAYDFGTSEAQTNTLVLTRTGTDLQVSVGFMYNSLQNNFGAILEIVPSLVPSLRRGGLSTSGAGGLGGLVTR